MSVKIIAKNKAFNDVCAYGVRFANGVGEMSRDHPQFSFAVCWYKNHGYTVEEGTVKAPPTDQSPGGNEGGDPAGSAAKIHKLKTAELEKYAGELGLDISACKNNAERADAIIAAMEKDKDGNAGAENVQPAPTEVKDDAGSDQGAAED